MWEVCFRLGIWEGFEMRCPVQEEEETKVKDANVLNCTMDLLSIRLDGYCVTTTGNPLRIHVLLLHRLERS